MADRTNLDEFDWTNEASPATDVQPEVAADPAVAEPAAPAEPAQTAPVRRGRPTVELDESLLPEYARQIGHKNRFKRPVSSKTNLNEFDWTGEGVQEPGTGGGYRDDEDWAPLQGFKTGWNTSRDSIYHVADMAQIMALPADQQVQAMIDFGNKQDDPNQAHMTFGGIEEIGTKGSYLGDAFTFVVENATQMAGSWGAAALYGGGAGALTGGAGGAAVGSVVPGVGTAAGAAAGALGGVTYGTMAAFGAMGVGGMYKDLLSDKGVQDALKAGTLSPTQVNLMATTAGAAIGLLDALPAGKIGGQLAGKAGKKVYRDTVVKAALAGLKHGAIEEGGTEAIQGAISEFGQAIQGGNWDLAERSFSVLNQGIAGAIGGAGPGAAGEVNENSKRTGATHPLAPPAPGPTPPAPVPPAPGPTPHTPVGGLGVKAAPPLGSKTGAGPDYGKTGPGTYRPAGPGNANYDDVTEGLPDYGRKGKVTVVPKGAIPDDASSALASTRVGSGTPEGAALDPAAAAGKPASPPTVKPAAAASSGVDVGIQAALGGEAGYKPGIGGPPAPAHSDVITGLPDYGGYPDVPEEDVTPDVTPMQPLPGQEESTYTPNPDPGNANYDDVTEGLPNYGQPIVEDLVPTPEPATDTLAQINAIRDPSSGKDAALVTPDSPRDGLDLKGLYRVETPQGLFVTSNRKKAAEVRTAGNLTEEQLAELLGYAAPKSESDGTVVQGRDAAGNVVHEEATDAASAGLAAQNAAAAVPGGDVVTTNATAAQTRRGKRGPAEATYAGATMPGEPAPAHSDVIGGLPDYSTYEDTEEESDVTRRERVEHHAESVNEAFANLNKAHISFNEFKGRKGHEGFDPETPPKFGRHPKAFTKQAKKEARTERLRREAETAKWQEKKRQYEELRGEIAKASALSQTAIDDIKERASKLTPEEGRALLRGLSQQALLHLERDIPHRREPTRTVESDLSRQHSNQPDRTPTRSTARPVALKPKPKTKQGKAEGEQQVPQRVTAISGTAERLAEAKAEVLHPKTRKKLGNVVEAVEHAPLKKVRAKTAIEDPGPITIGDETFETVKEFNDATVAIEKELGVPREKAALIRAAQRELRGLQNIDPDRLTAENREKHAERLTKAETEFTKKFPYADRQLKKLDAEITAIGKRLQPFHDAFRDGKHLAKMRAYEASLPQEELDEHGKPKPPPKGKRYDEPRVKLSFLPLPITLTNLFENFIVMTKRTKGTLAPATLESVRDRAIAAMVEHFAGDIRTRHIEDAAPVRLKSLLFSDDEITLMEDYGLAHDGVMDAGQFRRWYATERGLEVEPVATPRTVVGKPEPQRWRIKRDYEGIDRIERRGRKFIAKGVMAPAETVPLPQDRAPKRLDEKKASAESLAERKEAGWKNIYRHYPTWQAIEKALPEMIRAGKYREGAEFETEDIVKAARTAVPPRFQSEVTVGNRDRFEHGIVAALRAFDKLYIKRETALRELAKAHDKAMDDAAAERAEELAGRERLSKSKGLAGPKRIKELDIQAIRRQVDDNKKRKGTPRYDKVLKEMEPLFARRKLLQNKVEKRDGTVDRVNKRIRDGIDREIREVNKKRVDRAKVELRERAAADRAAEKKRAADAKRNKKFLDDLVANGLLEQDLADELASSERMGAKYGAMEVRAEKTGPVLRGAIARTKMPTEGGRDISADELRRKTRQLRFGKERTLAREKLKEGFVAEGWSAKEAEELAEAEIKKSTTLKRPNYSMDNRLFRKHLGDVNEPTEQQRERAAKQGINVEYVMLQDKGETLYKAVHKWALEFISSTDERMKDARATLPKRVHSVYNTPLENGMIYVKGLVMGKTESEITGTSQKGDKSSAPRRIPKDTEKFLESSRGARSFAKRAGINVEDAIASIDRERAVADVKLVDDKGNALPEGVIKKAREIAIKKAEITAVKQAAVAVRKGLIYDAAAMVHFMQEYANTERAENGETNAEKRKVLLQRLKYLRDVINGSIFQVNKNQSTQGEPIYTDAQVQEQYEDFRAGFEKAHPYEEEADAPVEEEEKKDVKERWIAQNEASNAEKVAKAWGVRLSNAKVRVDKQQQRSIARTLDEANAKDPDFRIRKSPERVDDLVSQWEKGDLTNTELRKAVKALGWEIDSLRGKYAPVGAYDPEGNRHEFGSSAPSDASSAAEDAAADQITIVTDSGKTKKVTPVASTNVRTAAEGIFKGKQSWIEKAIIRSVVRLIGDMPVHILDKNSINDAGMFQGSLSTERMILLHENLLNRPETLREVFLHELVHGATHYAITTNLHGTRDIIRSMMDDFRKQMNFRESNSAFSREVRYGFKNEDEFLAMALQKGEFQELLKSYRPTVATRARIRALGAGREAPSFWDMLVSAIAKVAATFAPGKAGTEYIDNLLSVYGKAAISGQQQDEIRLGEVVSEEFVDMDDGDILYHPFDLNNVRKLAEATARKTFHHNVLITSEGIRRYAAKTFFDGNMVNPVSRILNMLEQHPRMVSDMMAEHDRSASALRDWWMQDPRTRKALVAKAHAIGHEGSLYHVDPRKDRASQPHIWDDAHHPLKAGATRATTTFKHEQHSGMREAADRLHAEWNTLPTELKALASTHFDILNKMMVRYETDLLGDALKLAMTKTNGPVVLPPGMTPEQATKEIYERKVSPALKAALGANAKTFDDYGRLGLRGGLYVPSFRKGRYFIAGRFKVATPAGATRDTAAYDTQKILRFVFKNRARASAYVRDMGRTDDERVIGYSAVFQDPATGDISPKKTKTHTTPLFYVTVQNSFMAMSDSKAKLRAQLKEMNASGDMEYDISQPVELKEHRQMGGSMPLQLSTMLNNVDQMAGVSDAEKTRLKEGMTHVFVQSQIGNRITKRLTHRRGVFGAESGADEMLASFRSTAEMIARHTVSISRIEKIREATKELEDLKTAMSYGSTSTHGSITKLSPAMQALVSRNYAKDSDSASKLAEIMRVINDRLDKNMTAAGRSAAYENLLNSVMSAVTMNYLVGPSYLALNTASVGMFTYPRMAATFGAHVGYFKGWTMAAQYLWRSGQRISWLKNYQTGASEAMAEGRHFIKGFGPRSNWLGEGRSVRQTYDSVATNKARLLASGDPLAADMVDVLEEARLDNFLGQAGLDQANARDVMMDAETTIGKAGLKAVRGIEQSTRIFRALSDGIETNNRVIPLLSYYEFFRSVGMTHEEAKAKAINAMTSEQVGYGKENWSPWMAKGPVAAMLLFKKFPIQQAQNYYESIVNMVGDDPKLRKEAMYQVANTTLILGLIGGMSGNPLWEPFKYLYSLLAKLMGWGDYDELKSEGEKLMDKWIGGMPAEMVMYGAPRAIGIDVAGRVALDTIGAMSLPKEDTWEGVSGLIGQLVAGAPGSAAYKWYEFAKDMDSDKGYAKWLSNAPLPKFAKDIFKAADLYENGPTTATGVKAGSHITMAEAAAQVLGFRPSSQSRPFEVGSVAKRRTTTRINEDRKSLLQRLNNQGVTRDNARRLRDWNRSHNTKGERITMRDFAKSRRRRQEIEADIKVANRGN